MKRKYKYTLIVELLGFIGSYIIYACCTGRLDMVYKALGREKMLEMAEKNTPLVEALKIMKDLKTRTLRPKKKLVL